MYSIEHAADLVYSYIATLESLDCDPVVIEMYKERLSILEDSRIELLYEYKALFDEISSDFEHIILFDEVSDD